MNTVTRPPPFPRGRLAAAILGLGIGLTAGTVAVANPVGPQVIHGSAHFARTSGTVLNVRNAPNTIINWQGFSIGARETTRFIQNSAASRVLNRVVGQNPSDIMGRLLSNGRVYLINPAGILFGPNSVVDTAGFLASTLNIGNEDFLNGRFHFQAGPEAGRIENQGYIRSGKNGEIVLIAPEIENSGIVESDGGQLLLAAGRKVTLTSLDTDDMQFEVQAPEDAVINLGELLARNGTVRAFAGTIRNHGVMSADRVEVDAEGRVVLRASHEVRLEPGSRITARGEQGNDGGGVTVVADGHDDLGTGDTGFIGLQGEVDVGGASGGQVGVRGNRVLDTGSVVADGEVNGGRIEIKAADRLLSTANSRLSANGGKGDGGQVTVDGGADLYSSGHIEATGRSGGSIRLGGGNVRLAGAEMNASGRVEGGEILVGAKKGNPDGLEPTSHTVVNNGTHLHADAINNGTGGEIVLWAEQTTHFGGRATARGGADGGDGGIIEVSAKNGFTAVGEVDLTAPAGRDGRLVLDPKNIIIEPGQGSIPVGGGILAILDPNPGAGDRFGDSVASFAFELINNDRLLVLDPNDDLVATDSGAAYLFDLTTGGLVSALTGAASGDQVGSGGYETFSGTSNYLVKSPRYNGDAGALTMGDGLNGVEGIVGASNSLVGANPGDGVGSGGIRHTGINSRLILSPDFDNGKGAVTHFDPTSITSLPTGAVSSANSLVGNLSDDPMGNGGDHIGSGGVTYAGGRYIIKSPQYNGYAGALTWVDDSGSIPVGVLSSSNSLVGASGGGMSMGDRVGNSTLFDDFFGSNYLLVGSPYFEGRKGAVTFVNPIDGINTTGVVGASISLIGDTPMDGVGQNLFGDFSNGSSGTVRELFTQSGVKFALRSSDFGGGKGAITVGDVNSGLPVGVISASNSFVGAAAGDRVGTDSFGRSSLYTLDHSEGTLLVHSAGYNGSAGAVTILDLDDAINTTGTIGPGNSLTGASPGDNIGSGGIYDDLSGDAFLIGSPSFQGGVGAVTFGNASMGIPNGVVSAANSLIGGTTTDSVGQNLFGDFSNGSSGTVRELFTQSGVKFALRSSDFGGGKGAITVGDVNSGLPVGVISASNSFVGAAAGDRVGTDSFGRSSLYTLDHSEGTLLVHSAGYNGSAGAVTILDLDDAINTTGTIGPGNSLTGASPGDNIGSGGIYDDLSGDAFLIGSPSFQGGVGAVTFGNASMGIPNGVVSAANSLIGGTTTDSVGQNLFGDFSNGSSGTVRELFTQSGVKFALRSSDFGGGKGAITVGDVNSGLPVGVISSSNSFVGATAGDRVGEGNFRSGLYTLDHSEGTLLVHSAGYNGSAGAVTILDLDDAINTTGTIGPGNSLTGASPGDNIGSGGIYDDLSGDAFLIGSPSFQGGVGAVTFGNASMGIPNGVVSAANSLIGGTTTDNVGQNLFGDFSNGSSGTVRELFTQSGVKFALRSSDFGGGKGAITVGDVNSGLPVGVISSSNSFVGATAGDRVGEGNFRSGLYTLDHSEGTLLVHSAGYNGSAGAVTILDLDDAINTTGTIGPGNSLTGASPGDNIGSGGIYDDLSGDAFLIGSPSFQGGVGAVTFGNASMGIPNGVVSAANSLIGGTTTDNVGQNLFGDFSNGSSGTVRELFTQSGVKFALRSSDFGGGKGAITVGDVNSGLPVGVISSSNSFVGATAGDRVGEGNFRSGLYTLDHSEGTLLVHSAGYNGSAGAVTILDLDDAINTTGTIGPGNSLTGASPGDNIGSGGIYDDLSGDAFLIGSPSFQGGVGAVTFGNASMGIPNGVVSAANSLIGGTTTDNVGQNLFGDFSNGSSGTVRELFTQSGVKFALRSSDFGGGKGAITVGDVNSGLPVGVISSSNSFVGATAGDRVGEGNFRSGLYTLDHSEGTLLVHSAGYNGSAGAVTILDLDDAINTTGTIGPGNSLTGASPGDNIGSGDILPLDSGDVLVLSPDADRGGQVHAGRIDILTQSGASSGFNGTMLFSQRAGDTVRLGAQTLGDFLASGTSVLLQANNDILVMADANILGYNNSRTGGDLSFEAGRRIGVNADIVVDGSLEIGADRRGAPGIDTAFREAGNGDLAVRGAALEGGEVFLSGHDVTLDTAEVYAWGGPAEILATGNINLVSDSTVSAPSDDAGLGASGDILVSDAGLFGRRALVAGRNVDVRGGDSPTSPLPDDDSAFIDGLEEVFVGALGPSIEVFLKTLLATDSDPQTALDAAAASGLGGGTLTLATGTRPNSDAVIVSGEDAGTGPALLAFESCVGCVPLSADPFPNPASETGVWARPIVTRELIGTMREQLNPTNDILALTTVGDVLDTESQEELKQEEDDEEEEEEEGKEDTEEAGGDTEAEDEGEEEVRECR